RGPDKGVEDVGRHRRRSPDRFGGRRVTAATGVSREAQDYLTGVEAELADLPTDDPRPLIEDPPLPLGALPAEDDGRPLAVRLGSPAAYAADLRSAAGLPARATG